MIPQNSRFHGYGSLNYVHKNGRVFRARMLNLKVTPNSRRQVSRVSVIVSRKVFKSAVKRNRIRRRIYEVIRLKMPEIISPHDIVIVVTSGEALTAPIAEIDSQIKKVFAEAKIIPTKS